MEKIGLPIRSQKQRKKNWEANQKHVGMETIASVRLTGLNVRDKLSKIRNSSH